MGNRLKRFIFTEL